MRTWLLSIGLLLPQLALAQPPQPGVDPCLRIGGCQNNAETIISVAVQNTAALFVSITAGAAVLFVVVGGFQMLLSFGNDSMVTKGKNSIIYALGGFALTLAAQAIVSFTVRSAVAGEVITATANPALALMRTAVGVMMGVFNAIFVLVAVVAGIRMVMARGKSDEFEKARTTTLYAVMGAVAVNVARALVNIVLTAGF